MDNRLIIGLDISQGSATAFFYRGELPTNLRDFYEFGDLARHLRVLPQNRRSIALIRRLKPYRVILETTGRYSIWWRHQFDENGIIYEIANQSMLAATRRYVASSDNKDDAFDSLLLVKFFWDKFVSDFDRRCWLRKQDPLIARLRRLLLDVKGCNKKINQTKNSLKANLASEWPEVSRISSKIASSAPDALPAFWAWLGDWDKYGNWELAQHLRTRWDRRSVSDLAQISDQTRNLARIVCLFSHQKAGLQAEVAGILADTRFTLYHEVFNEFAFDVGCRAWLLARIYPFEQFLDTEGRAIVSYSGSGKTKKHRSKRRFKQVLGLGNSVFQSGQSVFQTRNQGSAEARSALWLYFSRQIEFLFDKEGLLHLGKSRAESGPRRQIEDYWLRRAYEKLPSGAMRKREGKTLIAARNATVRKIAEVLFSLLLAAQHSLYKTPNPRYLHAIFGQPLQ